MVGVGGWYGRGEQTRGRGAVRGVEFSPAVVAAAEASSVKGGAPAFLPAIEDQVRLGRRFR